MNLVQRVKAILLQPRETWPRIEREADTPQRLYTDYLMVIAAIPAIAGFIGLSLVGIDTPQGHFRVPIMAGLANMVIGYLLSLVAIWLLALVVNALAPNFKGTQDPLNALKLVVFGSTASMVGGIFNLIPALALLGLLAALYSIWLIYLGLPVLMKCPPEKALAYTAVIVLCGILISIVISGLAALVLPSQGLAPVASLEPGAVAVAALFSPA